MNEKPSAERLDRITAENERRRASLRQAVIKLSIHTAELRIFNIRSRFSRMPIEIKKVA